MTAFLLIIGYICLFGVWLRRSSYYKIEGLSKPFLFVAFVVKIGAGILYGHIHYDYFNGGDTSRYFEDSRRIYETIGSYPDYYWRSILGIDPPPVPAGADVFTYPESSIFWKDLGTYVLVHLHAILQPLTGGYYSVHVVFMALLGLLAGINFYRVFKRELDIPAPLLAGVSFFLPSLLFWTSGLHKDILVYWGLSLVVLAIAEPYRLRWVVLLAGLTIVGLFRHYLLALLVPAVVGYYWSKGAPERTWWRFAAVYAGGGVLAAAAQWGGMPVLESLVQRQTAFAAEVGNSNIPHIRLDGSASGIITAIPQAMLNIAFRPYIWDCNDFWQVLAALEIVLVWGGAALGVFFWQPQRWQRPLIGFLSFYAISNWLLIGLLVSNTGTMVRYRAIALSLLVVVLLQGLDYVRLRRKQKKMVVMPAESPTKQEPVLDEWKKIRA